MFDLHPDGNDSPWLRLNCARGEARPVSFVFNFFHELLRLASTAAKQCAFPSAADGGASYFVGIESTSLA
jgi:hypothetical protein